MAKPHAPGAKEGATLKLDGHTLTIEDVENVALGKTAVGLSEQAMEQLKNSRKVVEEFLDRREVVYGITTGFGKFKDVYIAPEETEELQKNFLFLIPVGSANLSLQMSCAQLHFCALTP
jgi:Histidine ammonia-lyase